MRKLVREFGSSKNEIMKYKSFRIKEIPTQKYPEKVMIVNCKTSLKHLIGRSFINLQRVKIFIENELSKEMIKNGKSSVENQLRAVGLGYSFC